MIGGRERRGEKIFRVLKKNGRIILISSLLVFVSVLVILYSQLPNRLPPTHTDLPIAESPVAESPVAELPVAESPECDEEERCFFTDINFKHDYGVTMTAFSVFVYPEGDPGTYFHMPHNNVSLYASESLFFRNMANSALRTLDHEVADAFFIPVSVQKMSEKGLDLMEMRLVVERYIQEISSKYPYWNKSSGADHFFVSCHDMALKATQGVPDLVKRAIRIVCFPEIEDGFIKDKDIVLPQVVQPFQHPDTGTDNSLRTELIFMGDDVLFTTVSSFRNGSKRESYMLNDRIMSWLRKRRSQGRYNTHILDPDTSKFCLCPSAVDICDGRITNAIHHGCVPVVWPELYQLPFSGLLNWSTFSVQMKKDDNLQTYVPQHLKDIPEAVYQNLQSNTLKARKYFRWNEVPLRYDAFNLIIFELWSRLYKLH